MNYLVISLTICGAGLIILSLPIARRICSLDDAIGWRVLFALLLFFIVGYLLFILLLIGSAYNTTHLLVSLILLGGGAFVYQVMGMTLQSISKTQEIAQVESHNALHDSLTGLPNRAHLHRNLQTALLPQETGDRQLAVMVIDLDRFKEINDTLGHSIGDTVLQIISQRFQSCLSSKQLLARLGGDEFALLLTDANGHSAISLAKKLHSAVETVIEIDDFPLTVDMSIGIAFYPEHGTDRHSLLKVADIAMYQAKRSQQPYMVYDESMDRYSKRRLKLLPQLKAAIDNEAFSVVYQPILDPLCNTVSALEALVRWPSIDGTDIPPYEFIPLAEETNVIKGITDLVIKTVIKQAVLWQQSYPDIRLCINLSVLDLQDIYFPERLEQHLQKHKVPATMLTFEITESAMMKEVSQVKQVLGQLNSMGACIAVDDFGTGYSSLSLLRDLPAQYIKIDRTFITKMDTRAGDMAIVNATVKLAHSIDRKVVAEGVESDAVKKSLVEIGCDYVQGFLISKPMTADKIEEWLINNYRKK